MNIIAKFTLAAAAFCTIATATPAKAGGDDDRRYSGRTIYLGSTDWNNYCGPAYYVPGPGLSFVYGGTYYRHAYWSHRHYYGRHSRRW